MENQAEYVEAFHLEFIKMNVYPPVSSRNVYKYLNQRTMIYELVNMTIMYIFLW